MLSNRQIARSLKRLSEYVAKHVLDHKLLDKRVEWLEGKVYEELPANIKKSGNLNTFSSESSKLSQLEDRLFALEEDFKQIFEILRL